MTVREAIKNNSGKIIFGSASSIIALVTALFSLDARYAHASDVERERVQTHKIIQESTQILRKQMIEDKLFELDIKKAQSREQRLSPVDSALRERYQRQIDEIVSKNNQ